MKGMKQQGQHDMIIIAPQAVVEILFASERITGIFMAPHFGHLTLEIAGRHRLIVVLYNFGPSEDFDKFSLVTIFFWSVGGAENFKLYNGNPRALNPLN